MSAGVLVVSDRSAVTSRQKLDEIHSQSLWAGVRATGIAYNNALTGLRKWGCWSRRVRSPAC